MCCAFKHVWESTYQSYKETWEDLFLPLFTISRRDAHLVPNLLLACHIADYGRLQDILVIDFCTYVPLLRLIHSRVTLYMVLRRSVSICEAFEVLLVSFHEYDCLSACLFERIAPLASLPDCYLTIRSPPLRIYLRSHVRRIPFLKIP